MTKEFLDQKRREFLEAKNNNDLDLYVRVSNSRMFDLFNSMYHNDVKNPIDNILTALHMAYLQIESFRDYNSELIGKLPEVKTIDFKTITPKTAN